jgi:HD-GYP domain-containing protein (c-di-GMP phosphodiesterase class II)
VGATLLDDISFLQDSLEGIKHHHERWDGRGYPSRLAGDAIPLASRIIAVADALDSVTRGRPGHDALPIVSALQDLQLRAGSHLDPAVVAALARVVESSPSQLREVLGLGSDDGPPWDHDDPSVSDLLAGLEPSTRSGQRG